MKKILLFFCLLYSFTATVNAQFKLDPVDKQIVIDNRIYGSIEQARDVIEGVIPKITYTWTDSKTELENGFVLLQKRKYFQTTYTDYYLQQQGKGKLPVWKEKTYKGKWIAASETHLALGMIIFLIITSLISFIWGVFTFEDYFEHKKNSAIKFLPTLSKALARTLLVVVIGLVIYVVFSLTYDTKVILQIVYLFSIAGFVSPPVLFLLICTGRWVVFLFKRKNIVPS